MKTTNTIIAFALLLVLGGVFYYLQQQPRQPAPGETPKQKLFSWEPEQVEEFSIEIPDQPAATFRLAAGAPPAAKADGNTASATNAPRWEVVSPSDVGADAGAIQAFLTELPKLEYTPLQGGASPTLAEYGLEHPPKVFRFRTKQGETVTLSIGNENPAGSAKYGKLDNSPAVFLLDTLDTRALEKALFDLRDKRVLPLDLAQAARLEIVFDAAGSPLRMELPMPRGRITLTKEPNGNWALTDPAVRTDYNTANYMFSTLTSAAMNSVEPEIPPSLSRYGLESPPLRLRVTTPAGSHELGVGNRDSGGIGFYAKNSIRPQVFTIPQSLFDQIKQEVSSYRDRYLVEFQLTNARRFDIQGPAGELRLDRRGEDWFRAGTPEKKLDSANVSAFMERLRSMRIQNYTTDRAGRYAEFGLDRPWLTVKVTFGENNQEETLVFASKNTRFYAARLGEPSVYEMGPAEPENLESKLKDLGA